MKKPPIGSDAVTPLVLSFNLKSSWISLAQPCYRLSCSRFDLVDIAHVPEGELYELNDMKREDGPYLLRYLSFHYDNKVRYALKFIAK
jgi:hypothetical protein